jgi:hypothetical protein
VLVGVIVSCDRCVQEEGCCVCLNELTSLCFPLGSSLCVCDSPVRGSPGVRPPPLCLSCRRGGGGGEGGGGIVCVCVCVCVCVGIDTCKGLCPYKTNQREPIRVGGEEREMYGNGACAPAEEEW